MSTLFKATPLVANTREEEGQKSPVRKSSAAGSETVTEAASDDNQPSTASSDHEELGSDDASTPQKEKDGVLKGVPMRWPMVPMADEVNRLGEVIRGSFAEAFDYMTVTRIAARNEMACSKYEVEVRLRESRDLSSALAPMSRLQSDLQKTAFLERHKCVLFRMQRGRKDEYLDLSFVCKGERTCWDAVHKGYCPRVWSCQWEHPVPVEAEISFAGHGLAKATQGSDAAVGDEEKERGFVVNAKSFIQDDEPVAVA